MERSACPVSGQDYGFSQRLCIHLCLPHDGQKLGSRASGKYPVLTHPGVRTARKGRKEHRPWLCSAWGWLPQNNVPSQARGKHRSLASGGVRHCPLDCLASEQSAHKLQPGPNIPQCHLCHSGLAGPPLCRCFKIQALSPSPTTADPHQLRHW